MNENKVSILNKYNEKLIGLETIPTTNELKYPTVILVHGFGVTKEESGMFDDLAQNLSEISILVYRFDFSGCGESAGDYSETSLSKLKEDLASIIEFVKKQTKVNTSKIGILAQSLGTATTVTLEPKIQCLILMGSVAHPEERLIQSFGVGYDRNGISTKIKSSGLVVKIKPQVWQDFAQHNLLESIKKINCPILFIHGEKDTTVPLSDMLDYFNNANEPKEKIIIQDADHGLRPHRDKMYKIAVDWFKKHLIEK